MSTPWWCAAPAASSVLAGDVHEIIRPLVTLQAPELMMFTRMTGDLVNAMRACTQPIVAAVDGVCAGAGAILAMAADLRYGTARSKTAFLFNRVGLAGCDMGSPPIRWGLVSADSMDVFSDRLIGFMQEGREDARPLFAHLAFTALHSPLQAPQEDACVSPAREHSVSKNLRGPAGPDGAHCLRVCRMAALYPWNAECASI